MKRIFTIKTIGSCVCAVEGLKENEKYLFIDLDVIERSGCDVEFFCDYFKNEPLNEINVIYILTQNHKVIDVRTIFEEFEWKQEELEENDSLVQMKRAQVLNPQ